MRTAISNADAGASLSLTIPVIVEAVLPGIAPEHMFTAGESHYSWLGSLKSMVLGSEQQKASAALISEKIRNSLSDIEYTVGGVNTNFDEYIRKAHAFMNLKDKITNLSYFKTSLKQQGDFQRDPIHAVTEVYNRYAQLLTFTAENRDLYSPLLPYISVPQLKFAPSSIKGLRANDFCQVIARSVLNTILVSLQSSIAVPFVNSDGAIVVAFIRKEGMCPVEAIFADEFSGVLTTEEKIVSFDSLLKLVQKHQMSIAWIVDGGKTESFEYALLEELISTEDLKKSLAVGATAVAATAADVDCKETCACVLAQVKQPNVGGTARNLSPSAMNPELQFTHAGTPVSAGELKAMSISANDERIKEVPSTKDVHSEKGQGITVEHRGQGNHITLEEQVSIEMEHNRGEVMENVQQWVMEVVDPNISFNDGSFEDGPMYDPNAGDGTNADFILNGIMNFGTEH